MVTTRVDGPHKPVEMQETIVLPLIAYRSLLLGTIGSPLKPGGDQGVPAAASASSEVSAEASSEGKVWSNSGS